MKFSNIIGIIIICLLFIAVGAGVYFVMFDTEGNLQKQEVGEKNEVEEIVETNNGIINDVDENNTNNINNEDEINTENKIADNNINDIDDAEISVTEESVETIIEKEYIEGFEVAGYISIPKLNAYGPIFSVMNKTTLGLSSVGVAFGNLNEIGHTVLMGHANLGYPFENISKLENGDIVIITDSSKREITYEVIDKQIVNSNDASYMIRQTNNTREITMQTGNSDTTKLTVIIREKN